MTLIFHGEQVLTFFRSFLILSGCSILASAPAFAQSKAEIDQVTNITKHVQTNYSALTFLADLAETKGDYKKEESCNNKILEIYKTDPGIGTKSARYAMVLSKIAHCDLLLNKRDEAAKNCKEALGIIDGMTDSNNPDEFNYVLMTKETCRQVMGKSMPQSGPPKAQALVLKPIPTSEIANMQDREKQVKTFMQNREKQIQYLTLLSEGKARAKGIKRKEAASKLEAAKLAYMKDMLYLANIYTLEKKYTLADPMFTKSLALIEKKTGKISAELMTPLSNYGYFLAQAGRKTEADTVLYRMQQIRVVTESQLQANAAQLKGKSQAKSQIDTSGIAVPRTSLSTAPSKTH
jgi:tetratricopeptide (TPR) repeat protein